jgi:hypothetical protein
MLPNENAKIVSVINLNKRFFSELNYLSLDSTLLNTDLLFLKANRPYLEYYFKNVSQYVIENDDIVKALNYQYIKNAILELIKLGRVLISNESVVSYDLSIYKKPLVVGYLEDQYAIKNKAKEFKIDTDFFFLPKNQFRLQIEPAWKLMRERKLGQHYDSCFCLNMGWEKIVLSSRIIENYKISFIDLGEINSVYNIDKAKCKIKIIFKLIHKKLEIF